MQIYLLMGGIYSFDGVITSAGMYKLRTMLREQVKGAVVQTYPWANYPQAGTDILTLKPSTKVVVIGYSGGGSHATWLARMAARPRIDLMICYDPSPKISMFALGPNVKRAICYHNTAPMFFGLGGGVLVGPQVETIDIAQPHLMVQFNQDLHRRTVEEVKKLAI